MNVFADIVSFDLLNQIMKFFSCLECGLAWYVSRLLAGMALLTGVDVVVHVPVFADSVPKALEFRAVSPEDVPLPMEAYTDLDSWWRQGKALPISGVGISRSQDVRSSKTDQDQTPARQSSGALGSRSGSSLSSIVVVESGSGVTIQDAIDQVAEGGSILIKAGVYRERIVIRKPMKITGEGGVFIGPPSDDSTGALVRIESSNVTLENLNISYARGNGQSGSGILISGTDLSQLRFDNVNAANNQGDGFSFLVSGKYESIEFFNSNAESNLGFGLGFYGGQLLPGRDHELRDFVFEGNRDDRGVISFNELGGISIRLYSSVEAIQHSVGKITLRNAVLESNYGASQFFIQGLTEDLTFEGCWFNGGPDRGWDVDSPLGLLFPSSQYAIILLGALREEFYTSIPPVKFIQNSQGQRNQFDGVYWFGALNLIGWNDLKAVDFSSSGDPLSGSGSVFDLAMQGFSVSDSLSFVKLAGVKGSLDLSGAQFNTNPWTKYNVAMGGQPFSADAQNPTPSNVIVDATQALFETSSGEIKTIGEMSLEERFAQSAKMVNLYNPSVRPTTALGRVNLVDSGYIYIVPGNGNSIQSILDAAPEGATIFVQKGEYTADTSLNLGRQQKIYFQGGLNPGGSASGGVNIPDLAAENVVRDSSVEVYEFGTPGQPGLAQVSGVVYLDENHNGAIDAEDPRLSGAVVFFDDNNNNVLDEGEFSIESDDSGAYSISTVNLGSRSVGMNLPFGFEVAFPTSTTFLESIGPGSNLEERNFLVGGVGTISGAVWEDEDADGVFQVEEAGLAERQLSLNRLGSDGSVIQTLGASSDSEGLFVFDKLLPGSYQIANPFPTGWLMTASPGSVGRIQVSGSPLISQNVGGFQLARISGTIYEDRNKSGSFDDGDLPVSGTTISMDMGEDGETDAFRQTDVTGGFSFVGIGSQPLGRVALLPTLSAGSEILESNLNFEIQRSGQVFDQAALGFFRPPVVTGQVLVRVGSESVVGSGILVSLIDVSSNKVVNSAISDGSGLFRLVSNIPGEFKLGLTSLPENTRIISTPENFSLTSGESLAGLEAQLALNRAPVIEVQIFTGTPELAPAGTLIGQVVAEDPEDDPLTLEFIQGNEIETVELRAWKFRSRFSDLYDVTTTKVFSVPPPFQPGKLLKGTRSVLGQLVVELFWLTPEGELFRNVYPVSGVPLPDNLILGDKIATLNASYYTNLNLLIGAVEKPQTESPFTFDAATGEIFLAVGNLTLSDQPLGGFELLVRATDTFGAKAESVIGVILDAANQPPVFGSEQSLNRLVLEGSALDVPVGDPLQATDPDGHDLSYEIVNVRDSLSRLKALDRIHQFADPSQGVFSFNARGLGDKWLHGARSRQWFYLISNPQTGRAELYQSPLGAGRQFKLASPGTAPALELSYLYYDDPSQLIGIANSNVPPNPAAFKIGAASGQLLVADPAALNPQVNPYFDVEVRATDSGLPALSVAATVRVKVDPTLDFPGIPRFSNFRIHENAPSGTRVGKVNATDPQGLEDIVQFEIRRGNAVNGTLLAPFRIDAETGELFVQSSQALDFETQVFHELVVRVVDKSQRWAEGLVIIDLINEDEAALVQIGTASLIEGNTGTSMMEIPVTLTAAFSETIKLSYTVESGTAEIGSDFEIFPTATPGIVSVIPGDLETSIRILVIGDAFQEQDETFTVTIGLEPGSPELLTLGTSVGTGVIHDDDRAKVLDNQSLSGFSRIGSGWVTMRPKGSFGSKTLFSDTQTSSAQWTFQNLAPGLYRVSASAPELSSVGFYSLWDNNRKLATEIRISTSGRPNGAGSDLVTLPNGDPVAGGAGSQFWSDLGYFTVNSGTLSVRLSSKLEQSAGLSRIKLADAIRVEPVSTEGLQVFINDPAPVLYNASQTVRVELNEASDEAVEVRYEIVDANGALSAATPRFGTLLIESGSVSADLELLTATFESPSLQPKRSFVVRLGPVVGGAATIIDPLAQGWVTPEVSQTPSLSLSGPGFVPESVGSIPMRARLDRDPLNAVTVNFKVSEIDDSDVLAPAYGSGSLTFNPGEREKTFTVLVEDNVIPDIINRRLAVVLTLAPQSENQVSLGVASFVVELEDDDGPIIVDAPDLLFGQALYSEINLDPVARQWSSFDGGYNGESRMIQGRSNASGATSVGQWRVFGLESGSFYRVSATWPGNPGFAESTPFWVMELDPDSSELKALGVKSLDQSVSPSQLRTDALGRATQSGEVLWDDIGFFRADTDQWRVQVMNNVSGVVVADAIRVEKVFIPTIETIKDRFSEAGSPLEVLVRLGHSDPSKKASDVFIQSVTSSSDLLVPNSLRNGAGMSWSSVNIGQGLWKILITPLGIRTGSVDFTVIASDGETPIQTTFNVGFERNNFLFDFGVAVDQKATADRFIAVAKNSLYRSSIEYGWIINRGLTGDIEVADHLVLQDAITGPVPVDFKLSGLSPDSLLEIDLLLGRKIESLGSGTLVQALDSEGVVLASTTFYYTPAEKPYSFGETQLLVKSSPEGEINLRFSPYSPLDSVENIRFALTAAQVRKSGTESSSAWTDLVAQASTAPQLTSQNLANVDQSSSNERTLSIMGAALSARGVGPVLPVAPPAWLDDSDSAFAASTDWVRVDGNGFQGGLSYFVDKGPVVTANAASWTYSNLESGVYRLGIRWTAGQNRSSSVWVQVRHQDEVYGPFNINQTRNPSGLERHGVNWEMIDNQEFSIAFDDFSPGTEREDGSQIPMSYNDFVVKLVAQTPGVVIADAVILERVEEGSVEAEIPVAVEWVEGDTISSDLVVEVNLSAPPLTFASVDYRVVAGTATGGEDIEISQGTLFFESNDSVGELLVAVFGDIKVEENEGFTIEWSNPQGMTLSGTLTEVLIIDDDGSISPQPVETTVAGLDGRLSGSSVWRDANRNGQLDAFEASTWTDSTGRAALVQYGFQVQYPWVARGGRDLATGEPLLYALRAPATSEVLNSLTTVLEAMSAQAPEVDVETHRAVLQEALGINLEDSVLLQDARAELLANYNLSSIQSLFAQTLVESVVVGISSYRFGELKVSDPGSVETIESIADQVFEAMAAAVIMLEGQEMSSWEWRNHNWTQEFLSQLWNTTGWSVDQSDLEAMGWAWVGHANFMDEFLSNPDSLVEETQRTEALAQLAQLRAYLKRDWSESLLALGAGSLSALDWQLQSVGQELDNIVAQQVTLNPIGANFSPGQLYLVVKDYKAYESEGRLGVEVRRVGGSLGVVGGVIRALGGTASIGSDVVDSQVGFTFGSGELGRQIVYINLVDDDLVEGEEWFQLELVSTFGGALLDVPVRVDARLLDDDADATPGSVRLNSSLSLDGLSLILSWPEYLDGVAVLEYSEDFGSQAQWLEHSKEGSFQEFGIRYLTVPMAPTGGRFYRLQIEATALGL